MIDELYIDNQRMDIGNTGIFLEYKSYILEDVSKLQPSHSYTIKCPKTANNSNIIDAADIVSSASQFPKVLHNARLIRDGIMLIANADAYILSVTDTIDICLVFNQYKGLAKLKDKNLDELESTHYIAWEGYDATATIPQAFSNSRFPMIDVGLADNYGFIQHPVLSLSEIFNTLQQEHNISFSFPSDVNSEMNNYVLPVLKRNPKPEKIDLETQDEEGDIIDEPYSANWLYPPLNYTGLPTNDTIYMDRPSGYDTHFFISSAYRVKYKIRSEGYFTLWCDDAESLPVDTNFIMCEVYYWLHSTINTLDAKGMGCNCYLVEQGYDAAEHQHYHKYRIDVSIELPEMQRGHHFSVNFRWNTYVYHPLRMRYKVYTKNWLEIDRLVYPYYSSIGQNYLSTCKLYLYKNLPSIKITDFIKSVCWLFGLFAYEKGGTIGFAKFNDLYNNKSNALNWTGKLISLSEEKFSIDNIAKKNIFKYKNPDDVSASADVIVNDQTLEDEKDYITSAFSAADNFGWLGTARIQMYELQELKKDDDGNVIQPTAEEPPLMLQRLNYSSKDGAYILKREQIIHTDGTSRYYRARFLSWWDDILQSRWAEYVGIMQNAKALTCIMRLNPVDLANLDFAIPIYLEQYGGYFAIQSIVTKDNEQCEVKFIKL